MSACGACQMTCAIRVRSLGGTFADSPSEASFALGFETIMNEHCHQAVGWPGYPA